MITKEELLKIKQTLKENDTCSHFCLDCMSVKDYCVDYNEQDLNKCYEKKHTILNYYDYEQDDYEAIIKFIDFLLKRCDK